MIPGGSASLACAVLLVLAASSVWHVIGEQITTALAEVAALRGRQCRSCHEQLLEEVPRPRHKVSGWHRQRVKLQVGRKGGGVGVFGLLQQRSRVQPLQGSLRRGLGLQSQTVIRPALQHVLATDKIILPCSSQQIACSTSLITHTVINTRKHTRMDAVSDSTHSLNTLASVHARSWACMTSEEDVPDRRLVSVHTAQHSLSEDGR